MKKNIFYTFVLSWLSLGTQQALAQADVEGLIRSTGQFPKFELYDNGAGENRVEFMAREAGNVIFLESLRGNMRLGASTDGTAPSNYLTITDDGHLGFNTTNPQSQIHIKDPSFNYNLQLYGTGINWSMNNGDLWGTVSHFLGAMIIENSHQPTNTTQSTFLLNTRDNAGNNQPKMHIRGDGNVGIGHDVDAPLSDVVLSHSDCSAGCNDDGVRIMNNSNTNNWWTLYTSSVTGNLLLYSKLQGNTIIGTFNDNTGAYSSSSNEHLKTNIKSLANVLEKVTNLRPTSYNYKVQDNDAVHIGFIAQELEQEFPEFVTHIEEQDAYTVNYAGMSTIAIKAIQEQQEIINHLQQTINTMEARLQALEEK